MSISAKKRMRRLQTRNVPAQVLDYRQATARLTDSARASTVNEDERSLEAVLSSEQPVEMFDWERYEWIPEVLRADGMETPANGQVPLLDSHNRWGAKNVLGSVRNIRPNTDQAGSAGRVFFDKSKRALETFGKYRDGHMTDFSAGYRVMERTHVPAGERQIIGGRDYAGPVNVVTKWRLRELSSVPIGADDQAKARGISPEKFAEIETKLSRQTPSKRKLTMDAELRKELIARGMPADLDDTKAFEWLAKNRSALLVATAPEKKSETPANSTGGTEPGRLIQCTPAELSKLIDETIGKREQLAVESRARFDGLLKVGGFDTASREQPDVEFFGRVYGCKNADDATKLVVDEQAARAAKLDGAPHLPISFGRAQADKHRGCLQGALLARCEDNLHLTDIGRGQEKSYGEKFAKAKEKYFPAKREQGWEQFRYARLVDFARECLIADGISPRALYGKPDVDIAMAATGRLEVLGIRDGGAGAYNTTGSFPQLTLDAINKSMMIGYEQYPATWRGPMTQGMSARDFKNIHRVQLGAVPNLQIWDDVNKHAQGSFADAQEQYAVEIYSMEIDYSYKLIINDDMNALSRTPQKMGDAASRTVNVAAWAQITSNPTMRDGQPLFSGVTGNRLQSNIITTGNGGAPSVAQRQKMRSLMAAMRGNVTPEGRLGDDILSLAPTYLVSPVALDTTVLQLIFSSADPSQANPAVFNPGYNTLIPVIEPLLDINSLLYWYLFASPSRVETAEVTFLQGQEEPKVIEIPDYEKFGRKYVIMQTFAAKALDWRGMVENQGS